MAEIDVDRMTVGEMSSALHALRNQGAPAGAAVEIAVQPGEAPAARAIAPPPRITLRARW